MMPIPEQLMLIALNDEKGTISFAAKGILPYCIIGAMIFELYFSKRIDFNDNKIVLVDNSSTDNFFYDAVMKQISKSGKPYKVKKLILKLYSKIKGVNEKTIMNLVSIGILREETQKVFGFISKKNYPMIDGEVEAKLRKDLHTYIFEVGEVNERFTALLSLIQTCNLFEDVFQKEDIKTAKNRLTELIQRTHEGLAISETTARFIMDVNLSIQEVSGSSGSI